LFRKRRKNYPKIPYYNLGVNFTPNFDMLKDICNPSNKEKWEVPYAAVLNIALYKEAFEVRSVN
jgi:hypothetical protein